MEPLSSSTSANVSCTNPLRGVVEALEVGDVLLALSRPQCANCGHLGDGLPSGSNRSQTRPSRIGSLASFGSLNI